MRTIVGFIFFSLVELVPLWAITTEGVGGLGASPRDVGHFMTLAAVANITFTVAALGRCVARLSQRRSLAATGAAAAAGFVLLSLVRGPGAYPPSWAPSACFGFTAGAFSLVYMASMVGTTASIGLTNSVAPPAQRGLVNGIAVTVEGVGKGMAPALTGSVFAATVLQWGRVGHFVMFFLLAVLSLGLAALALTLPLSIDDADQRRASEQQGPQQQQQQQQQQQRGAGPRLLRSMGDDEDFLRSTRCGNRGRCARR